MIGYIEGKILKKEDDRVLVLVNQIGYEVLLPAIVMKSLQNKSIGEEISLYIFFQQTERQPKPVLIGFNLEVEKEFFQHFISVEAIGPLKAVRALSIPVREIATAIESGEINKLAQLKGIGRRTAQKIIATLEGKMAVAITRTGMLNALTAFSGPIASTEIKCWKNSFSTSRLKPIKTGLG